jgi:serine protease Do
MFASVFTSRGVPIVVAVLALSTTVRAQEVLEDTQFVAGARVRSAFRDVVADARGWTVRVLKEGKPTAMGVIVRENGWILTKASRLEGTVSCRLLDGRILTAEQAHVWPEHDLALLKVDEDSLCAVQWSEGGDPMIGQWVATSGHDSSPLGVGIVSVARRAIPLVRQIGVLGVRLDEGDGAATIVEVFEESSAEKADLRVGDVVSRIDDEAIPDRETMVRYIRRHEPGQTIHLQVTRGEKELTIDATLSHPFGQFLSRIAEQNQMGGELSERRSDFPAVIQHDTVLAPDECGGTVVDLDGRALGINIARAGRTESFAIPVGVIRPLLEAQFPGSGQPSLDRTRSSLPSAPPSVIRNGD